MQVPKRKHSKGRVRRKRNSHYKRAVINVVKTKDGKALKRPHFDEYIEL
jgi:ribosomal protein L32